MIWTRNTVRRRREHARIETLEVRVLLSSLSVTTTVDGASGSLRDVINRAAPGDVVNFSPLLFGATIPLTQGEIPITKSLTIQGTWQTIDAGGHSRIFEIDGSSPAVTLSGLTLRNGVAAFENGLGYAGGALFSHGGTLNLTNVSFVGNSALGGAETLDDFEAAPARGGALFVANTQLLMQNCVVQSNAAIASNNTSTLLPGWAQGGGLMAVDSTVTISGGQFSNNRAVGGSGLTDMTTDSVTVVDGGWGEGGAIFLMGATTTLTGTTLQQNLALGGRGLDSWLVHVPQDFESAVLPGAGGVGAGGAIMALPSTESGLVQTLGYLPGSMLGFGSTQTGNFGLTLNAVNLRNNLAQGGDSGASNSAEQFRTHAGQAYGGAICQAANILMTVTGGSLVNNTALGGNANQKPTGTSVTASNAGGDAYGGAIYSREFASATANRVLFSGNRALGGKGADALPEDGQEGGDPGYAQGGAWSMYTRNYSEDPSVQGLAATIQNSTFFNNVAQAGANGQGVTTLSLPGYQGFSQGGAIGTVGQIKITSTGNQYTSNQALASRGQNALGGAVFMETFYATNAGFLSRYDGFTSNLVRGGDDPLADTRGEFSNRDVAFGGAVALFARDIRFECDTFSGNIAQGGSAVTGTRVGSARGGAVWLFVGSDLEVPFVRCTFIGNEARGGQAPASTPLVTSQSTTAITSQENLGGAIEAVTRPLTITGGSFIGNRVVGNSTALGAGASGGALHLAAFRDGITIPTRTSGVNFSSNLASSNGPNISNGGAIALNRGVSLSDTCSTLSGNSARNQGGGQAFGGGIATEGPLFLAGTKLLSNTALALRLSLFGPIGQGFGGGIAFFNNPLAQLTNVWFLGNLASTAGNNVYGIYHSNPI